MTFFGLQLHPQYTTWAEMRDAALLAEQCGWDVLMTWDHFVPLMGDVTGPNLEGWQVLAAFGAITTKPKIGFGGLKPGRVKVRSGHVDHLDFFADTGIR